MISTPDRRVRVFVSSTLEELAEERAAARQAIENLRLTPVLFEIAARAHPPRELYQQYLEQSDVFVGIYGESYGWVAPGEDVSGLEREYRLATALPRLLYVKRPAPRRDPRLAALIAEIEEEAAVSYKPFADAAELRRLIADDLALLLSERFAVQAADRRELQTALPATVDPFVGRGRELERLEAMLVDPQIRLVTVTGPGGIGKTRLALEAARRASGRFAAGAHFVPLGSLADAALVAAALYESLGAPYAAASPLAAAIDQLRDAELLLVLDNFEHVLAAATDVQHLLEACQRLSVVVTSRAVLKLRGEHELRLDPLADPDAVALFTERARAANASFELTEANRSAVEEICRRLDGIPLALELAAAQVRVLPPQAILERFSEPLRIGAASGPSYPDRQRTLHDAIDWSFTLLDEEHRIVCARAGVFRGGFTLPALEAVAADGDPVEALAALVESSLIRQDQGEEPRYSMLGTIRAYALERLEERGELEDGRRRHAEFYAGLAEQAGPPLRSGRHELTLAALDLDADNVRTALDWMLGAGELERVAAASWALVPYWTLRERHVEGRRWLRESRRRGQLSRGAQAKSLVGEAILALWSSDYGAAGLAAEGLEAARASGEEEPAALAQLVLGMIDAMRGAEGGVRQVDESRAAFERLGSEWGAAMAAVVSAWGLNVVEEDVPLDLYEEAVAKAARLGFEVETLALGALGRRHALRGETEDAKRVLAQALERTLALRADVGVVVYVDLLADLAAVEGDARLAARLAAAAEAVANRAGAALPAFGGNRAARLSRLRDQIGDGGFAAELDAGRALGVDAAAAEALAFAYRRVQPYVS